MGTSAPPFPPGLKLNNSFTIYSITNYLNLRIENPTGIGPSIQISLTQGTNSTGIIEIDFNNCGLNMFMGLSSGGILTEMRLGHRGT